MLVIDLYRLQELGEDGIVVNVPKFILLIKNLIIWKIEILKQDLGF